MATATSTGITVGRNVTDDFSSQRVVSSQDADALKNVETRVAAQAEGASRRSGVNSGNEVSGGAFEEVPATASNTSGMAITDGTKVPVSVRKVDFKDLKTGADYRGPSGDSAKASVPEIADTKGVRKQMKGQQTSKFYKEDGNVFESFPGNRVDQND